MQNYKKYEYLIWNISLIHCFCLLSTTSSTASSCDTEFTKEDEQRLKDYVQQLKNDKAAVKLTMLELESVHIDPLSYDIKTRGDGQRLDLENAVLMQELMAMKVSKNFTIFGSFVLIAFKSCWDIFLQANILLAEILLLGGLPSARAAWVTVCLALNWFKYTVLAQSILDLS